MAKMGRVGRDVRMGVEWELKTAIKGIVQAPSSKKPVIPAKVKKPELVNDIDDHEYY